MPLTDAAVRGAKPKDKPYKLGDSLGLFLLVQPSGGKLWRFKYRVAGREKKLSVGAYPETVLSAARKARDDARELLAAGKDPAVEKRRERVRAEEMAGITFAAVAEEYCDKRKRDGHKSWAPSTAKRCEHLLEQIKADIGAMPIGEIQPIDVLAAVRRIEAKGQLESARRALQLAGAVFRHAVATARLASDPTRDLKGALIAPAVEHYGAVADAEGAGALLRAIEGYEGFGLVRLAMQFAAHVFVRPGELRHAMWREMNFENAVWAIPAEKTKMRKEHRVPLSRQALAILTELHAITGPDGYVFPSVRSRARPMSENTMNAALRRLGYTTQEMTAHGFRAMASTLLNESGKWSPDVIERALAHGDKDKVRAAYHRGAHWQERVEMAQWWSDHLDQLRQGVDELKMAS